jgi:hypothetical protein
MREDFAVVRDLLDAPPAEPAQAAVDPAAAEAVEAAQLELFS